MASEVNSHPAILMENVYNPMDLAKISVKCENRSEIIMGISKIMVTGSPWKTVLQWAQDRGQRTVPVKG